jgi:hypothetical protein
MLGSECLLTFYFLESMEAGSPFAHAFGVNGRPFCQTRVYHALFENRSISPEVGLSGSNLGRPFVTGCAGPANRARRRLVN